MHLPLAEEAPSIVAQSVVANPHISDEKAIRVENVSKLFGRFAALRKLTADFSQGKLYVVIGENGAGKSTLLRIIAGLARPTFGTVAILGFCSSGREARNAGFSNNGGSSNNESSINDETVRGLLGYMGHSSMLYDELSGLENLNYFHKLYERSHARQNDVLAVSLPPRNQAENMASWWGPESALRAVGLDPALTRTIGQYSQGMRQRASLARAVQHDPRILLLDEPFSNVDGASAQQMLNLVARMRDSGRTIMLTTHQPMLTEQVADEYILMREGQIASRTLKLEVSTPPGIRPEVRA